MSSKVFKDSDFSLASNKNFTEIQPSNAGVGNLSLVTGQKQAWQSLMGCTIFHQQLHSLYCSRCC